MYWWEGAMLILEYDRISWQNQFIYFLIYFGQWQSLRNWAPSPRYFSTNSMFDSWYQYQLTIELVAKI